VIKKSQCEKRFKVRLLECLGSPQNREEARGLRLL
jgi:hypothetical protein